MSRAPLVLLLSLAACAAGPPGEWPSLAMRPGEVQPLVQRPAVASATPTPAAVARGDAASQLASVERDITTFASRLATQRDSTAKAAAAGKGGAIDSAAGSAAQLELSRLDRLGGQGVDLRERLDRLAGDYARAAAGGTAGPEFARIGTAIERVETLRAEQAAAYAAASTSLRR